MLPIEISAAQRLFLADAGLFGLGLKLRCGVLGQPLGKFIEDRLMSGIIGKVSKFIRVVPVIVKLLRAILINNEPPIAAADGVVIKYDDVIAGCRRAFLGLCNCGTSDTPSRCLARGKPQSSAMVGYKSIRLAGSLQGTSGWIPGRQ